MARQYWKPSNLLNPVPCVMISCRDEDGKENVMTAASRTAAALLKKR